MSQVQTAVLSELQTAHSLRRTLREKIGDACSEQRARYLELETQLAELERSAGTGECSEELLAAATKLSSDLSKLRQHLKDGRVVRLSA